MRKLLFIFFIIFAGLAKQATAQELNCRVQVVSQQIQGVERRIFETLETSIFEFMNNRKWTDNTFSIDERIECSIMINITKAISNDEFTATIAIQSRRPIYKSSYHTTMLNHIDADLQFKYLEFQPLEFSLNNFNSNLTSVLAFYAYFIIGIDYDSFGLNGGTPHLNKAQTIVANAQSTAGAEEKGWKAHTSIRNRYWLIENMMNATFQPLRDANYIMHRKGMDIMTEDIENGQGEVFKAMEGLKTIHKIKPGSYNMQVFFNAKADEVVNIFTMAAPATKQKSVQLLSEIDPGNIAKYQKILTN
ncbi:MAG: DUF4835 family protein [Bacteroidetes bacterium]|nr:DUF4835 family protein [Bacteroidota bacterium]